ncbi:universal stress protein [Saccharophagus sp. K07]|jgi:universal stress protein A|uniref:universal stress protein n=1 Tax=Saccharophagus sp. K07 TaxID=2283636 RepID=UPI0016523DF6|nr:universal stress protein [Saccharophagus sp. K07]MBC6904930.1 universal stress protein [Saccharophagus sp. K07]
MSIYTHLLVGLDLSPDSSLQVARKAVELAKLYGAKLSLLHVIEPVTFAYAGDIPMDLTETQLAIEEQAEKRLTSLAAQLEHPIHSSKVVIGQTAAELRETAAQLGADLIVVGSHGRHGLALLLGSTASDVLHGAKCDVLAVRV